MSKNEATRHHCRPKKRDTHGRSMCHTTRRPWQMSSSALARGDEEREAGNRHRATGEATSAALGADSICLYEINIPAPKTREHLVREQECRLGLGGPT